MTTLISDLVKKCGKRKQVSKNQKPSKVKKCGYWKTEGHTKVICPLLKIGIAHVGHVDAPFCSSYY